MCGIVAYVGKPDPALIRKLVFEASVRGLHHEGSRVVENAGIYHTRYCTSGETPQPLHYAGRWLAFNGVIDMGTKEEMEQRYMISMDTDNDGELFLQLCNSDEDILEFINNPKRTFAGVLLLKDRLIAVRNHGRPLWLHISPGYIIIASTRDIFERAGIDVCYPLEPMKVYTWTI